MDNRFAWLLGAWLLGAGQLDAQPASTSNPPQGDAPADKNDAAANSSAKTPVDFSAPASAFGYPFWFQAEYLLWQVKNAPLPVPIVTTGDPNVGFDPNSVTTVNAAGAIGQPGTQVLLGGNSVHFPLSSGMRFTLGGWVSVDQRLGIEGSGFALQRATSRFAAASDAAGSPALYFPILSGIAGAERGIPIADPLRAFSGDVAVSSNLQLWGAEGNAICALYRQAGVDFAVLAGVRYLDLKETLQIRNTTKDLLFNNVATLNDSFRTDNEFYGGQFGARLAIQHDWLFMTATAKIALGSAHQIVNVQGDIAQAGPNPLVPPGLGTFPGGLFTQPSNIGRHNANPLSGPLVVLPSLELKMGCRVTDRIRAFAGYDILYLNQVLRPGNQINHNVNLSQNAVLDPNGAGTLVGPAQPAPLFNRSDFWAQGVNFGFELSF